MPEDQTMEADERNEKFISGRPHEIAKEAANEAYTETMRNEMEAARDTAQVRRQRGGSEQGLPRDHAKGDGSSARGCARKSSRGCRRGVREGIRAKWAKGRKLIGTH
jgi:hypothetical protein